MVQTTNKRFLTALNKVSTFKTRIAGITYHINPKTFSMGVCEGVCKADPNNQYDPNAQAIYIKNMLVGYIPKDDLDDYIEFSDRKVISFVGMITPFFDEDDNKTKVAGEITLYKKTDDTTTNEDIMIAKNYYLRNYKGNAEQKIEANKHHQQNLKQVQSLRNNTTKTASTNNNGGCFTSIVIAVILSLAALI